MFAPCPISQKAQADWKHVVGAGFFSHVVDPGTEKEWAGMLDSFNDANLFQTLPFCSVRSPRSRVERFVVSKDGEVVAAAAVRVTPLPWPATASAYVRWGPLWRKFGLPPDAEVWRQALRGLRAEYVLKRNMWLRLTPMLTEADGQEFVSILAEQGYTRVGAEPRPRTMLINLATSLDQLRKGLEQKWRNCLNRGERNGLEIVEGTEDWLIEQFLIPYHEMISRKGISEPDDARAFRAIQRVLDEHQKMRVFLAYSGGEVCAGCIVSLMGNRGIFHFGATGNKGMHSKASHVLQWRIVRWLKQRNCFTYDLHGVNRTSNPGVYHFKAGLCGKNGTEVAFLGSFDACRARRARLTAGLADLIVQRRAVRKGSGANRALPLLRSGSVLHRR